MKRLICFLIAIFVASPLSHGQQSLFSSPSYRESLSKSEMRRHAMLLEAMQKPASDPNIDVTYYKLNLSITTSPNYLRGVVTMNALSVIGNLTAVTLDLMNSMTVDSVKTGNTMLSFLQQPATVTITLDRSYTNGELVTTDIYYRGVPRSNPFGGFTFASHAGTPWMYTLSAPYGARDWWPCKDHPLDKSDSVDVLVTVNSAFKVGSNGKLASVVDNGNGTKTHRWEERYPISTYLVSIAITNYAEFTDWFKYSPTDSMPVLNYVLPEHLSDAQAIFSKTVGMLTIYSNAFGLYPFIKEKYGHAEFGWNAAMEHQTMTSFGVNNWFGEELVAHELVHQWFGDMITCANWPNIWMNEGFATYCTGVYYEGKYGKPSYNAYLAGLMSDAKNAVGSLYAHDTSNVNLFDWNRVYAKGASVLHMLRHVLGDSIFFRSLKTYAQDPHFRFAVATTEDFKQVCETVSGKQLGYFFDEWIYGENYPRYWCQWKTDPGTSGHDVTLRVIQTTGTTVPQFFTMPIDCRLAAAGWDTTVVIFDSSNDQQFILKTSHKPDTVQLDPQNWILREALSAPLGKPMLSVDTKRVDFGWIDVNVLHLDSSFAITNVGGGTDSVFITLDYASVSPESAVTVFPIAFSLAAGSTQIVKFSINPRMLMPGIFYYTIVKMDSRFAYGPTHFEKMMYFPITGTLDVRDGSREIPHEFALEQNYPNPFNPSTTIRYGLPHKTTVQLSVFNTLGQSVSTLVNGEMEAGFHEVKFDASGLSSGIYFYRLQAGNFVETRKLLLVR